MFHFHYFSSISHNCLKPDSKTLDRLHERTLHYLYSGESSQTSTLCDGFGYSLVDRRIQNMFIIQGRSVVYPFRYAQEGGSRANLVPRTFSLAWGKRSWARGWSRASRGVWGNDFLGARKCHFPCFPEGSFKALKKADYSVILLFICQPLVILEKVYISVLQT